MSVSLLVGLLPCWNKTIRGISPVLEKITSWNLPCLFLAVPLASGQVHRSTSHSVTEWLSKWPSKWVGKLKISVNIDARTLKFGMEHPLAHWLRFRKNQFEGSCEDHVFCNERAILWPFLEKGSIGYTQQFLIGIWTTLGTLIKIQEEAIGRTIWGPCFAIKGFWPFLEKGATGFIQQCKIVLGVSLGALIKIKHHVRTIFGWKRDSFWPFLGERAMEYL